VANLVRRISWYAVAPVFVFLASAAVSAYGASAQVQGDQTGTREMLNDSGTFSVERTEIGVVAANQNESSSPCTGWGSYECIAKGGLSGGHWFLLVELRLDTVPRPSDTYAVSVQVDSEGEVLQPVEFAIPSPAITGSVGDFSWDLGSSFNTPLAYTVVVSDV
jgi:hypothetical protein